MADAIKKVIRRIRHKFKPPPKLEHPLVKIIAEIKGEQHKREFWERDKKNKRDENFKKALIALEAKREEQRQEIEQEGDRRKQHRSPPSRSGALHGFRDACPDGRAKLAQREAVEREFQHDVHEA